MEIIKECRRLTRHKVCLSDPEKEDLRRRYGVDADNITNISKNLMKIDDQIMAWKFLNTMMMKEYINYSSMSGYRNKWALHYDKQYCKRPDKQVKVVAREHVMEEILKELQKLNQLVEHISDGIELIYHDHAK